MSKQLYVLIKRDLYECPEHQGYTGIKELAGAWPLSLVQSETVPVKDKYDRRNHDHYALPVELAPEFTNACFHDLAQAHLQKKVAAKDAEIAKLRDLIRWAHDSLYEINPSNYDHDEVCKINDASVEVILGLAPTLGESHGKSAEWWESRAALKEKSDA
jgi:hypothetical protein